MAGDLVDGTGATGTAGADLTSRTSSTVTLGVEPLADDIGRWLAATVATSTVRELELDRTDSADALILGDPAALAVTATHLRALGHAFGRTAHGFAQVDVGRWSGAAAEAFHAAFADSTRRWIDAADAFDRAADVVAGFAATLTWAKERATQAAARYRQGVADSEQAAMARAWDLLVDARRHRDAAGVDAARALALLTALAPPPPPASEQVIANGRDGLEMQTTEWGHVVGGVGEGVEAMVKLGRTLDPADPYHRLHPAAYVDGVSSVAAGLVHTTQHPIEVVKNVVGTGWGSDPSAASGRLIPDIVLAVATGGTGVARAAARRAAVRTGDRVVPAVERDAADLEAVDGAAARDLTRIGRRIGRALDRLRVRDTAAHIPGSPGAAPARTPADRSGIRGVTDVNAEPAIHAATATVERGMAYLAEVHPHVNGVNRERLRARTPGADQNCTRCVPAVARAFSDGAASSAVPWVEGPGWGWTGGTYADYLTAIGAMGRLRRAPTYDAIIRYLHRLGEGAHGMVHIERPDDGSSHVFNAVHDRNGVTFIDGQTGVLATLEAGVRISFVLLGRR